MAEKSRGLVEKEWKKHRHVHKNYNYRTGMGLSLIHISEPTRPY